MDDTNTTFLILRHLLRTSRMTEVTADSLLGGVDLSMTELMALCQIKQADGQLSLGSLAQCMAFVKSNATQVIDRMEKDERVRRVLSSEDRRSKLIEITDEGRQAHATGLQAIEPLMQKLETLSPDERAELLRLLQKVGDALA